MFWRKSATAPIPSVSTKIDKTVTQITSLRDGLAWPVCFAWGEAAWDGVPLTGEVSERRTVIIPCFNPRVTSHQFIG